MCVRVCELRALVAFNLFPFTLINCYLSGPNQATEIYADTAFASYVAREWLNGIYKRDSAFILHLLLLLTDSEYIKMCATAEYLSGADLTVPLKLELP